MKRITVILSEIWAGLKFVGRILNVRRWLGFLRVVWFTHDAPEEIKKSSRKISMDFVLNGTRSRAPK